MENIYTKLAECEQNNQEAAFCLIISTKGSTPRKLGSKMLVYSNGNVFGTIGGGNLEFQVKKDAINVIKNGNAKLFKHDLVSDHSMSCGGSVEVYIEPDNDQVLPEGA